MKKVIGIDASQPRWGGRAKIVLDNNGYVSKG